MTRASLALPLLLAILPSGLCRAQAADSTPCVICFYGPDNIAFDSAGNGYITDSDHRSKFRIVKVSPEGKQLGEWHVFTEGSGSRKGPEGIVATHHGTILVTDGGSLRVLELSLNGTVIGTIGEGKSTFKSLGHVAVNAKDEIFVSDAEANSILTFKPDRTSQAVWKKTVGSDLEQWRGPEGISITSGGVLAVEDWGNQRVSFLSRTGQTKKVIDLANKGAGESRRSAGICLDRRGNVYVADDKLHDLREFDRNGHLLRTLPADRASPIFSSGPQSVNMDRAGNLYVVEGLSLIKMSSAGKILQRLR